MFEQFELENGLSFTNYKEALKQAGNDNLFLVLYNDRNEVLEKIIVNKEVDNVSNILYIITQKVINGVEYEHSYQINKVIKSSYRKQNDQYKSTTKNVKINTSRIINFLKKANKHGVNYYIVFKDYSQKGVCISELDLKELNELLLL